MIELKNHSQIYSFSRKKIPKNIEKIRQFKLFSARCEKKNFNGDLNLEFENMYELAWVGIGLKPFLIKSNEKKMCHSHRIILKEINT